MHPILDHILSKIISWRLRYLEYREVSNLEFECLKLEYFAMALECLRVEGRSFDSIEDLAEYLEVVLEKAKERIALESYDLHRELRGYGKDLGSDMSE